MRLAPALALALAGACAGDKGGETGDSATAGPCAAAPGCLLVEDLAPALMSVRAPAADDVWVTGASPGDGSGPVLLHFDGAAWTRLDTAAWAGAELWWGWVDPDEAVFVGNDGLVLELDRASGALRRVEGPPADTSFYGVWGASGDDLWAVGETEDGEGPPALWRRQGGAWTASDLPPDAPGSTWFKVHGRAADDLWIVGTQGAALHWDGAGLTPTDTTAAADTRNAPLLTVDAGGAAPVAVGGAGNGLVLVYEEGTWRDHSPAFQPGMNGVCAGAGTAWAVGIHGARARGAEGPWISDTDEGIAAPTVQDWHGCALDPAGGLWTVGGHVSGRPLTDGVLGYQGPTAPPAPSL